MKKIIVTTLTAAILVATSAAANDRPGKGYDRTFSHGHIAGTKCDFFFTQHPLLTNEVFEVKKSFIADGSYYGNRLFHNRNKMAAGTKLHECDATVVAYNSLPLGTVLRITNPENDRQVLAVVQDRGGPNVSRRPDLARGLFERLKGDGQPADGVLKKLTYEVLVPGQ